MRLSSKQLQSLVSQYQQWHSPILEKHLNWYRDVDLDIAIERAARMEFDASGAIHPHQRFRQLRWFKDQAGYEKAFLPILRERKVEIEECREFDELYKIVQRAFKKIKGAGDLTTYDTSLRIGACKKVEPKEVYLQSGALKGARAFLSQTGGSLKLRSGGHYPVEVFSGLDDFSAAQFENFLCIAHFVLSGKKSFSSSCLSLGKGGC